MTPVNGSVGPESRGCFLVRLYLCALYVFILDRDVAGYLDTGVLGGHHEAAEAGGGGVVVAGRLSVLHPLPHRREHVLQVQ